MLNSYRIDCCITVANFSISESVAPSEASPISCENCANKGSANMGAWPRSSWITSLKLERKFQRKG